MLHTAGEFSLGGPVRADQTRPDQTRPSPSGARWCRSAATPGPPPGAGAAGAASLRVSFAGSVVLDYLGVPALSDFLFQGKLSWWSPVATGATLRLRGSSLLAGRARGALEARGLVVAIAYEHGEDHR
jgi:hypothetical protein